MSTIETHSVGRLRTQEHRRRRTESTRFQIALVCRKGFGTLLLGLRPYSLVCPRVHLSPMNPGDPGLLSKPVIFKNIFDERATLWFTFIARDFLFRY